MEESREYTGSLPSLRQHCHYFSLAPSLKAFPTFSPNLR